MSREDMINELRNKEECRFNLMMRDHLSAEAYDILSILNDDIRELKKELAEE